MCSLLCVLIQLLTAVKVIAFHMCSFFVLQCIDKSRAKQSIIVCRITNACFFFSIALSPQVFPHPPSQTEIWR